MRLGLTIPCGALQFDLNAGIGPKLIARDLTCDALFALDVGAMCASNGWGRWYGNHLDLRAIKEFTPEGWTASFARIAEAARTQSAGARRGGCRVVLRPRACPRKPASCPISGQTPLKHGAFLVRMKTEPHDIENALARSLARKETPRARRIFPRVLSARLAAARAARLGRTA